MNSEFIKKAYSNSEYTPEQIEELKKCFHDPIYFMKTYVKVMHPKKGVVPFELYEYQEEAVKTFQSNTEVICKIGRQMGKCVTGDTKITIGKQPRGIRLFALKILKLLQFNPT